MVYKTDDEALKRLGGEIIDLVKASLVPDNGTEAEAVVVDSDTVRQRTSVSKGKRKLVLQCPHSPGDITMLTAAIRDLHNTYPGEYQTDVESPCNEIFEGSPFITHLDKGDPDVAVCRTHYPIIHDSNEGSYHFIHGYRKHLEEIIGRPIKQGKMKTDIYIRDEEKGWVSAVQEATGDDRPFWIIDAGYKNDFTAKAWSFKRYQQVVDHFRDKIQFAQIGHKSHNHPDLRGVINLLGQTDSRQLIRLVYHSVGVLTPVSWPMVLAAGVPMKKTPPLNRACVVLSGGREPVQWQMYPNHQFLHTCGTMMCCDNGGCWKSRVVPLGDGDDKDKNNLCLNPVKVDGQNIAMCMARITVADVVRAIERYYEKPMATLKYDLWVGRKTVHIDYENRDKVRMNTYDDDKKEDRLQVIPHQDKTDTVGSEVVADTVAGASKTPILDLARTTEKKTMTATDAVATAMKG